MNKKKHSNLRSIHWNVLRNFLTVLRKKIGKELFAICFPLILTDNGHEFSDIDGLENSLFGGKRTRIFFCEPNRSDQKRTILPKGTSFKSLTEYDALLITNHINSYAK